MLVTLEPFSHTYKDERGLMYKSVSSLLSEYKHPFEPHKVVQNGKTILENYTQKNGGTQEEWLDTWEKNKDFACDRGHAFHSLKELVVSNSPFFKVGKDFMPVRNINMIWKIIGEGRFNMLPPGIYTEVCCWNYTARIAGTMDLLILYPDHSFSIKDYKTNGEFRTQSYMDRPMKLPFLDLPDCHYGHYTVQLSLYAWLLIQHGWKLRDLEILYYKISDENAALIMQLGIMPSDLEPESYDLPYVGEAIQQMIDTRIQYLKSFNPKLR